MRYVLGALPLLASLAACQESATQACPPSALADSLHRWPNEPAGFTTLTDWSYDQLVTRKNGKQARGSSTWNQKAGTGSVAIVCDSGAPLSPQAVVQVNYPAGLLSGTEPWTLYFYLSPAGREYYTAFWWKTNDSWEGDPSGINKITFWQDAAPASANLVLLMNNQRQPGYVLSVMLEFNQAFNDHLVNAVGSRTAWQLFGNVNGGNYPVVPGAWYRVELYFKGSTTPTSRDGIVRWWVTKAGASGPTQVGNYVDVNFDTPAFLQFSFAPTWGGNSGVRKRALDYYRIDHVHVSHP